MAIDVPDIATLDTLDTAQGTAPDSVPDIAASPRSRRSLLAGALGALVGGVAGAFGRPSAAQAAAGDPLILGQQNFAGTAGTRLTTLSSGGAFWMTQNGFGSGVRGDSVNGHGGVFTTAHDDRYGLFAQQLGHGGAGAAVRADGNANDGLSATTTSATEVALRASNSAVNGTVALFENTSGGIGTTAGPAIRAYTGGGSDISVHPGGIYVDAAGEFAGPIGVIGASSTASTGVLGLSPGGEGVRGIASGGSGVRGTAEGGFGVYGSATTGHGVRGESASGYAVIAAGTARVTKYFDIDEMAAPAVPAANVARLFVRDNGGKTELCVIFPTGVLQVIKTEL